MHDFICGALSGISQTFVGYPFDTYKVLIQNNKSIYKINPFIGIQYPIITSTIVCSLSFGINDLLKKYNVHSSLSGFISGACISPIIYINDNFKIREQMNLKNKINIFTIIHNKGKLACFLRESIGFSVYFYSFDNLRNNDINIFISGGISGFLNWTISYPFDVIRNRQLAQNIDIITALKMGKLWKGYTICAFRSVFVNSVGFFVYENSKKYICN